MLNIKTHSCAWLALSAFLFRMSSYAAEPPKDSKTPEEKTVVTTHTLTIDGRTIRYHATAGTLLLRKDDKETFEPRASVFYVAYTRDGTDTLRRAMAFNPYMKVFVARGYYDQSTPLAAAQYTFDHLGLPESERGRVETRDYEAGHMTYVNLPSLEQLSSNLHGFITRSIEKPERQ